MKYELLKRSHIKRNIIIGIVVVLVLSAVVLTFTRAKYRTTQSIPLIQGTINFSPSDLNLMAVYLNKNGETISSDKVPHVGYTLNTEQSICEVNDEKDEAIEIVYENGLLNFNGLGNKGTKCTAYFDLIPDSEKPVINAINSSSDDTSITITVDATDNIGIYYYYYKLDNEEEVRSEEASYTFDGLVKDSVHTVTVRVVDAAENEASDSDEVTVGFIPPKDVILASSNAPTGQTTDWTNEGKGITYYYTGNSSNWVQFAGFYWRIIRINGDGSIRMIYQGTSANTTGSGTQIGTSDFNSSRNNNMYVGFKYTSGEVHGTGTNSTILGASSSSSLNTWYSTNLADDADKIDGNAGFCGDRTPSTSRSNSNGSGGTGKTETYYGAYIRLVTNNNPSLQCSDSRDIYTTTDSSTGNKSLTYPIGLLTADEYVLAGSENSYLNTGQTYWTMSPSWYSTGTYARGFVVYYYGDVASADVTAAYGVRPVINLRSDVQLTGSGTTSDPFKIVGA